MPDALKHVALFTCCAPALGGTVRGLLKLLDEILSKLLIDTSDGFHCLFNVERLPLENCQCLIVQSVGQMRRGANRWLRR